MTHALIGATEIEAVKRRMEIVRDQYLQDNDSLYLRFFEFKRLEGALLTVIEGIGLPEKQERIIKDYITREVWLAIHQAQLLSKEADDYLWEQSVTENTTIITP